MHSTIALIRVVIDKKDRSIAAPEGHSKQSKKKQESIAIPNDQIVPTELYSVREGPIAYSKAPKAQARNHPIQTPANQHNYIYSMKDQVRLIGPKLPVFQGKRPFQVVNAGVLIALDESNSTIIDSFKVTIVDVTHTFDILYAEIKPDKCFDLKGPPKALVSTKLTKSDLLTVARNSKADAKDINWHSIPEIQLFELLKTDKVTPNLSKKLMKTLKMLSRLKLC